MSDLWDATSAIATVGATAAAVFSWRAARQANRTAEAVARIERDRWRHEMTPQFEIELTTSGTNGQYADVVLTFTGPVALDRLDSVEVSIRDDGRSRLANRAGGPTQEEIEAQVWGPYGFQPGIDEASPDGRSVPGKPLELGEHRKLRLQRTVPPHWTDNDYWEQEYRHQPVRLLLRCRHAGHKEPWVLVYDKPFPAWT